MRRDGKIDEEMEKIILHLMREAWQQGKNHSPDGWDGPRDHEWPKLIREAFREARQAKKDQK